MNQNLRRMVLTHGHIFKNAGTTIDWILKRNYKEGFCDHREDDKIRSTPGFLGEFLSLHKDIKAFSSHSLPLPVMQLDQLSIFTIVMLRDPLLRVRSVYDFERKQKANTPGAIHAKKLPFPEYVQWRMRPDVAPTIRNMHVRYLTKTSCDSVENLTSKHLDAALSYVRSNPLVGIVENFDSSMVVFDDYLVNVGIDLDFSYRKQNVANDDEERVVSISAQLEKDLGSELFNELLAKNSLDFELYNFAVGVVEERFRSVDNSSAKLQELKSACFALA